MRSLVLLALLGLALARHHGHRDDDHHDNGSHDDDDDDVCRCSLNRPVNQARERFYNDRLDGQNLRLDDIEEKINAQTTRMEGREAGVHRFEHAYRAIRARIERQEGTHCPEGYLQCGNENHICVNHLLVCDGTPDCDNGHDEEDSVCVLPVVAGTILDGNIYDTDLCTRRRPFRIRVIITQVERSATYAAYPSVSYTAFVYYHTPEGEDTYDILHGTGYINFSERRFHMYAPENDHLGIDCVFDGVHQSRCEARVLHDFTHETCVSFVFRIEDNHH